MLVDNMAVNKQAGLGSPGLDELRWLKPVYPGDTLRVENEIVSKRQSVSKPEMGSFQGRVSVFNQDDEMVMTMVSIGLIRVRGDA
jgi:acyl dehydratase